MADVGRFLYSCAILLVGFGMLCSGIPAIDLPASETASSADPIYLDWVRAMVFADQQQQRVLRIGRMLMAGWLMFAGYSVLYRRSWPLLVAPLLSLTLVVVYGRWSDSLVDSVLRAVDELPETSGEGIPIVFRAAGGAVGTRAADNIMWTLLLFVMAMPGAVAWLWQLRAARNTSSTAPEHGEVS